MSVGGPETNNLFCYALPASCCQNDPVSEVGVFSTTVTSNYSHIAKVLPIPQPIQSPPKVASHRGASHKGPIHVLVTASVRLLLGILLGRK